jgi:hypothetical protein
MIFKGWVKAVALISAGEEGDFFIEGKIYGNF